MFPINHFAAPLELADTKHNPQHLSQGHPFPHNESCGWRYRDLPKQRIFCHALLVIYSRICLFFVNFS
jgi:hypothetical protein